MKDVRTTVVYHKMYMRIDFFLREVYMRAKHVKNMLKLAYFAATSNHHDFSYVVCRQFHLQYEAAYGPRGKYDPYKLR